MLIAGFPAGAWGTNCYLVAPAAGEECVIIHPGHQAAEGVEEALKKHRLKPVAVVLTHGHIDHVASVVPVCGAHDVPAWIHPEDRFMMSDPEKALGRSIGMPLMGELTVGEPDDVPAVQQQRNGRGLDGGRALVAELAQRAEQPLVGAEVVEGGSHPMPVAGTAHLP